MGTVYILRLLWLFRYKAPKDRQPRTGLPDTSPRKGILYSWANIAMPWEMESTRTKPLLYVQFVIFHLGVTSAILLSFIIPYAPSVLEIGAVVILLQIIIGAAFLVGVRRIIRRFSDKYIRAISTPDDYFSLFLLTIWFFFATLSVPNYPRTSETVLLIYFWMTAFFLVYVPFSKISHYLYYPITRYYFGRTMGYRGVYPLRGTQQPELARN
jgi:nitrate reductase gamma subunit